MEMEGRGFSGLYKNSSEELLLKTLMESPIGMPVPTMEMLGFKNVSQSFSSDSEELFKRWLTNGEGYNSQSIGLSSRLSKKMSTELANNVSNQQHVGVASEGRNNDKLCIQNNLLVNDVSGDFNFPIRRRYTEMQNGQTKQGTDSISMVPHHVEDSTKQEITNFNGFDYITMTELPSQKASFVSYNFELCGHGNQFSKQIV